MFSSMLSPFGGAIAAAVAAGAVTCTLLLWWRQQVTEGSRKFFPASATTNAVACEQRPMHYRLYRHRLRGCTAVPCHATMRGNESSPRTSIVDGNCDFSQLPGDPSLVLTTNVSLTSDVKLRLMKAASKTIASVLGKPESYVAVCLNDAVSIIWAGEETPCALGCLYSLGSINQGNNAAVTAALSDLLAPHGVPADRIYINFFDVPRENCGWSGRTFAG